MACLKCFFLWNKELNGSRWKPLWHTVHPPLRVLWICTQLDSEQQWLLNVEMCSIKTSVNKDHITSEKSEWLTRNKTTVAYTVAEGYRKCSYTRNDVFDEFQSMFQMFSFKEKKHWNERIPFTSKNHGTAVSLKVWCSEEVLDVRMVVIEEDMNVEVLSQLTWLQAPDVETRREVGIGGNRRVPQTWDKRECGLTRYRIWKLAQKFRCLSFLSAWCHFYYYSCNFGFNFVQCFCLWRRGF